MATGFIDKARITCRAGNGGNGAVAFHREKYVAAGGPGAVFWMWATACLGMILSAISANMWPPTA